MKRLTCTLAALAMVMLTHIPAQAEFLGTLHGDQPWTLSIDNSNNDSAAGVTIFYLGGKNVEVDIHTLQARESLSLTDLKIPRRHAPHHHRTGPRSRVVHICPGHTRACWILEP